MLPSHNSWRTAKVTGPALNLDFFVSSIVGSSLAGVCKSVEDTSKNWKRAERPGARQDSGGSCGDLATAIAGPDEIASRSERGDVDRRRAVSPQAASG